MQFKVSVEFSFIIIYNIRDISKCFKSLQLAQYECFKDGIVLFYGVIVSTQDFDSCDPSSILGRTQLYIDLKQNKESKIFEITPINKILIIY